MGVKREAKAIMDTGRRQFPSPTHVIDDTSAVAETELDEVLFRNSGNLADATAVELIWNSEHANA
jgi:hypothetical protein